VPGTDTAGVDETRLAAAVARHLGVAVTAVDGLRRLSGGASRETYSFDVVLDGGGRFGLILRRDPGSQGIGALDAGFGRSGEAALLAAAAAGGVPVPAVRFVVDDADGLGTGFVMDRVDGETIPRKILRDEEYAPARPLLAAQCGTIAAHIHAVDVAAVPHLPAPDAAEHATRAQLDQYRGVLDLFGEPHPAFELGLRWLGERVPEPKRLALVHGDFRNGNFIVGPDGIRAVLDWEIAHIGDPIEDLGWLCVKSWRFGVNDKPVGGFGQYDELLDAYQAAGGDPVDPDVLRFWEAFGTLKWGIICISQAFRHLGGQVRSVELATLGRRVCEMEYDLLQLLD